MGLKMNGEQSAKGREFWRDQQPEQSESIHRPEIAEPGVIRCCGEKWASDAFQAHLRGERVLTMCNGIRTTAKDEAESYAAWRAEREQPHRLPPTGRLEDDPYWRAEMVNRYYENLRRGRRNVRVDGADSTTYNW